MPAKLQNKSNWTTFLPKNTPQIAAICVWGGYKQTPKQTLLKPNTKIDQ